MMTNEKPGGHGERSVAVGTLDMALWDAVAKIEGKPLYRLLAERYGDGKSDERVLVYAAGGYYYPGKDWTQLQDEMRGYLDLRLQRGQDEDRRRAARRGPAPDRGGAGGRWRTARTWRSMPTAASTSTPRSPTPKALSRLRPVLVRGSRRSARLRAAGELAPALRATRWRPARTCSRCRTRAT